MSLINKMLRDLDQRQAPQINTNAKPSDSGLRRGTASVGLVPATAQPAGRLSPAAIAAGFVLLALTALVAGGAFWWMQRSPVVAAAPVVPQTRAQPAPEAIPAKAAEASHVAMAVAVAKPPAPHEAPAKTMGKLPATAKASAPVTPVVLASKVTVALPMPTPTPTPVASTIASADAQGAPTRQLQAGREALAQAQSLWNAGSREAAGELLQQALALAERSAASSPTAANTQLLATLAREQARMQLADGKPQLALKGLTRLEPLLPREADTWAMRGNAAQRLGRHQDSVQAYTTALQIRPNEQRWLLGAAVSMAALGQTNNAAEWAAKARALGPISKEVQNYMRQAGVPLNEP